MTATAQHTPGPWEIRDRVFEEDRYYIMPVGFAKWNQQIASVYVDGDRHGVEEANARLIAAAPVQQAKIEALADALEAALDAATCDCPKSDLGIGGRGHWADCWTAIARSALRAVGRLP